MSHPDHPPAAAVTESDVNAYLERIGIPREATVTPSRELLFELHRAHMRNIPFENFDTLTGIAPTIAIPDVLDKFIVRRRGGYCFEQATLFKQMLMALGFHVYTMVGRMHYGRPSAGPRCHGVLGVVVDGVTWLCDVGFNGVGMYEPIPLVADVEHISASDRYLLTPAPRVGWLLQRWMRPNGGDGKWTDLYSLQPEESIDIDFEHGNFFTARYPKSPFLLFPMVGMSYEGRRVFIRGKVKIESEFGSGIETVTPLPSVNALMEEVVALTHLDESSQLYVALRSSIEAKWDTLPA